MNRLNASCCAAVLFMISAGVAPGAQPAPSPLELNHYLGKKWYGIYLMGQKIGWAEAEIAGGYQKGKVAVIVTLSLTARVSMAGTPQDMEIREKRVYVPGEGLVSCLAETRAGGAETRISGEVKSGKLQLVSRVGGEETATSTDAPKERFEDYIAEEVFVRRGASIGDEISFAQYQPALQKTITAVSRIKDIRDKTLQGVPARLYVVETTIKEMGIVSTSILNSDGDVLQARVAGVFTMRLEDEKTAKNMDYRSDILLATVIRPKGEIKNPSAVRYMKARLGGIADRGLMIPSPRQKFTSLPDGDSIIEVNMEDLSTVKIAEMPLPPGEFNAELSPDIYIQSGHRSIVELARRIVGKEKNARVASDRLVDWVYRNIDKKFSATFSNALDVLAARSGDCTEHSILYVALARAAGLPAREVSGIVYSGEDKGFYYHQWAEAYVGEWIAVDPTFGQHIADATHIKFASGGFISQARIMNLIGSLKVEILDSRTGAAGEGHS